MIESWRENFNLKFTDESYREFLADIWSYNNGRIDFRISETPLFIDYSFSELIQKASLEIAQELSSAELTGKMKNAIPKHLNIPDDSSNPVFMQFDFGIVKDEHGNFVPQLIELQGFPSLYAFQCTLEQKVREHFELPVSLTTYFSGYGYDSYVNLFRETLLKDEDPENVILLEVDPKQQKTRIDFRLTERLTGVKSVCISEIIQRAKKLFYKNASGKEIPIKRIYNRVIFDELDRTSINYNFDFNHEIDAEWIGHPNWFFKISKFILPYLKSQFVPECYFLKDLAQLPDDPHNYVIKPLFSFAGSGVIIDVTKRKLESIENRENYILQRKVEYAPVIKTPDGYSKCEIRMMFIWKNGKPVLVNNLLRTTKGKMVGVDYNKNKTWVGSNIVFHPI
ncbi:MAG: hypothetical protein PHW27_12900 [Melioribacteraceae bacterium]|nr:hypothetical protein [Melioribacteraceae bacterium]MDD3559457.1 hypothetical protein [Melioribacteraceae bacterium]